jgi:hypothetical protein
MWKNCRRLFYGANPAHVRTDWGKLRKSRLPGRQSIPESLEYDAARFRWLLSTRMLVWIYPTKITFASTLKYRSFITLFQNFLLHTWVHVWVHVKTRFLSAFIINMRKITNSVHCLPHLNFNGVRISYRYKQQKFNRQKHVLEQLSCDTEVRAGL